MLLNKGQTGGSVIQHHNGSTQQARLYDKQQASDLGVDGRSFNELLVLGKQISAGIRFSGGGSNEALSWLPLFENNIVVILASIATLDLNKIKEQFICQRSQGNHCQYQFLLGWFRTVNRWHIAVERDTDEWSKNFNQKIESLICNVLRVPARRLKESLMSSVVTDEITEEISFTEFHGAWKLNIDVRIKEEFSLSTDSDSVKPIFEDCYNQLEKGLSFLSASAKLYPDSILYSKKHDPALGMFMAFLKLYRHPQNQINTFCGRERAFYYRDVLNARPQEGEVYNAYLAINPVVGGRSIPSVKKGSIFSPSHKPPLCNLNFVSQTQTIPLSSAQPASILWLSLLKQNQILPASCFDYTTGLDIHSKPLVSSKLFPKSDYSKDNFDPSLNKILPMQDIGSVIESRELYLAEGKRSITLDIFLNDGFMDVSQVSVSTSDNPSYPLLQYLSTKRGEEPVKYLERVLEQYQKNDVHLARYCDKYIDKSLSSVFTEDLHNTVQQECFRKPDNLIKLILYKSILLVLISHASTREKLILPLGYLNRLMLLGFNQFDNLRLSDEEIEFLDTRIKPILDADERRAVIKQIQLSRHNDVHYMADSVGLSLTTPDGWRKISNFSLKYIAPKGSDSEVCDYGMSIQFTLQETFPPVTLPKDDTSIGLKGLQSPALRLVLNRNAHIFAYDIFNNLEIKQVNISSSVSGINDLIGYDNHGELDMSMPFQPFGAQLENGKYWIVGSYELAQKNIRSLSFNVKWSGLPSIGFQKYYTGYKVPYLDTTYQVDLLTLTDRQWKNLDGRENSGNQIYNLFTTDNQKNSISDTQHFSCNISSENKIKPMSSSISESDYEYQVNCDDGFYKLALRPLEEGYGYQEYLNYVSSFMMSNGACDHADSQVTKEIIKDTKTLLNNRGDIGSDSTKSLNKSIESLEKMSLSQSPKDIPKPPYIPVINGVSLSYTAIKSYTTNIHETGSTPLKIYHLTPFGYEPMGLNQNNNTVLLFPVIENLHNAYIGFIGSPINGVVSLYLNFSKVSTAHGDPAQSNSKWSYLVDNKWVALENEDLIFDGTEGLQSSGQVIVNISRAISNGMVNPCLSGQTLMPEGMCWLRVSSNSGSTSVKSLDHVSINVVKVSCHQSIGADLEDSSGCPRNRLFKPKKYQDWHFNSHQPGINSIVQQGETFGCIAFENTIEFETRVAERLRHKNRASTPWDYERLVLERFPHIDEVKCLNVNTLDRSQVEALQYSGNIGATLMVVAHHKGQCLHNPCNDQCLDASGTREIRDYLATRASAFSEISVINPIFDIVTITCNVVTNKSCNMSNKQRGELIDLVNTRIQNYICPWSKAGPSKHLGWKLDVESLKASLTAVDLIDEISHLNVTANSQLADIPWRLWIPNSKHNIHVNSPFVDEADNGLKGVGIDQVGVSMQVNHHA